MTAAIQSAPAYEAHLTNGDGLAAQQAHRATHQDVVKVVFERGSYNSRAVAVRVCCR